VDICNPKFHKRRDPASNTTHIESTITGNGKRDDQVVVRETVYYCDFQHYGVKKGWISTYE